MTTDCNALGVITSGKSTGEGWLDEDKIDTNRAERAGVAVHGSPHGKGLTLPKSIESGNLSHNEAVLRWMPAICDFLRLFWGALE
jgi:hypothetical protein